MTYSQSRRKTYVAVEPGSVANRIRVRVLMALLYTVVAFASARLLYLQVLSGGQHTLLSDNNHLERKMEYARRGNIFDRNGIALTENLSDIPSERKYLLPEAAHLLGYIAETREDELGCREGICYKRGEWIGRSGVEKTQERVLKGKDGGRVIEVNALGQEVRDLGSNEPEPGGDITLSIDSKLQKIVSTVLAQRTGSAVAIDMNGKVLALASSPTYDPNLFTIGQNAELLRTLFADKEKQVFLNRAISGAYAPGSVFKLVMAIAGLASGKITKETLIEDTGEIRIDNYRYGNWYFDQYGRKEGQINVEKALARSNDIFFYKLGEEIGVDEIVKWAKKFGYGELTGIELPGEQAGLVPSRVWKEKQTGEKWFLGNTYHLSIGQGDLLATPIQVARATAAVISGRLCTISILKETAVKCNNLSISSEDIETVKNGMKAVCSTGGTAFPFFDFVPPVLCKTGTAQHAGQKAESDKPHAWIVVAYPAENPRLLLTVMLEAAGEGSAEAGPVAKEIISTWRDLGN